MRFKNNITPTDIDGMVEYQDKAMIFMEFKLGDADLPYGQCVALKRNVDNNQKAGKQSVLLVCQHNIEDCLQDIDAAESIVRRFYYNGHWYEDGKRTAKQVVDSFIEFLDKPF